MRCSTIGFVSLAIITAAAPAGDTTVVDFEDCAGNTCEGWSGPSGPGGATSIDPAGGNPDRNLHTVFSDFFINFRNSSNPQFVRDFSTLENFTLSVDLKAESISFAGSDVTRPWLVEIRDHDDTPPGYAWVSVWYLFSWVGEGEWTTWSVRVENPAAAELPEGWGGTGAEDPRTFEPGLPADRTFADVLAGADSIVFTTGQPGLVFGLTDFDLRIDNVTITTNQGTACPADLNGDGLVDAADMGAMLALWGAAGSAADLNDDGVVDAQDLGLLLVEWGPCA